MQRSVMHFQVPNHVQKYDHHPPTHRPAALPHPTPPFLKEAQPLKTHKSSNMELPIH